ncbi:hypothetical protein TREES_T100006815 [Tupaia chinensis]|uniref:Uncharacterized protein n=1 Tax=Tupaia chinensis TaxID=246437 RepID=L9J9E6_TUPCH|nr:hypothetical protein TREES_T100006815 [Tupaia chinensis]
MRMREARGGPARKSCRPEKWHSARVSSRPDAGGSIRTPEDTPRPRFSANSPSRKARSLRGLGRSRDSQMAAERAPGGRAKNRKREESAGSRASLCACPARAQSSSDAAARCSRAGVRAAPRVRTRAPVSRPAALRRASPATLLSPPDASLSRQALDSHTLDAHTRRPSGPPASLALGLAPAPAPDALMEDWGVRGASVELTVPTSVGTRVTVPAAHEVAMSREAVPGGITGRLRERGGALSLASTALDKHVEVEPHPNTEELRDSATALWKQRDYPSLSSWKASQRRIYGQAIMEAVVLEGTVRRLYHGTLRSNSGGVVAPTLWQKPVKAGGLQRGEAILKGGKTQRVYFSTKLDYSKREPSVNPTYCVTLGKYFGKSNDEEQNAPSKRTQGGTFEEQEVNGGSEPITVATMSSGATVSALQFPVEQLKLETDMERIKV